MKKQIKFMCFDFIFIFMYIPLEPVRALALWLAILNRQQCIILLEYTRRAGGPPFGF